MTKLDKEGTISWYIAVPIGVVIIIIYIVGGGRSLMILWLLVQLGDVGDFEGYFLSFVN